MAYKMGVFDMFKYIKEGGEDYAAALKIGDMLMANIMATGNFSTINFDMVADFISTLEPNEIDGLINTTMNEYFKQFKDGTKQEA